MPFWKMTGPGFISLGFTNPRCDSFCVRDCPRRAASGVFHTLLNSVHAANIDFQKRATSAAVAAIRLIARY